MKKTIIATLVIGMMAMFSANAQEEMDKFMVQVDGLGCPFCAYGLEKKFKEFKGIKAVEIDIETGDFSFNYPSEKALTLEDVENQVEKAGYTPNEAKVERANGQVESSGATSEVKAEGNDNLIAKDMKVGGNCAMCEARIKKAAKSVEGVTAVSWDKDSKIMLVNFDETVTSMPEIEKSIAKAGHDTYNHKAEKSTYEELPACCHYERIQ